ncbi:23S rRNA (guanine(745)-N(1))-methyltransferase [Psychrobacter nivimaris]|uniref:23S rRNA (Guanine(745)-N(1))-methyltransferase n=1 Tax=Psychrobacter nivimaris TaxID=281738 RepID=A0A6N7BY39_9GAMM|nr:rRNA (guanine-N1)-methyltransferase [Psychrobacter nivimaris]KAF0569308.1 23S rRNA (guanine(745)-N(1))-methyltransferase [Psychrobacter nivimaris]|tara:strand:- start:309 stop:1256 length:948 start_codon:yes stop_codon:yes gene_type:complete
MPVSLFICPLCQSPLQPAADTWRCDGSLHPKQTSHPFDVARRGYVNLLPVQQKKSKAPGDSQESIDARKRFLNHGHYAPLQELISQKMIELLSNDELIDKQDSKTVNWLDIGCGEGYYTQAMAQMGSDVIDTLIAADISKPAVVELAKVSKIAGRLWYQPRKEDTAKTTAVYPLVTSAAHLPLRPHSMTGISSIFSPILPEAFDNVLMDGGYLIIAKPDVGHLATMRDALFDDVREHDSDKFLQELAPYFTLVETCLVSTELTLSAEDLADLMTMTPYAYRARSEKRQALLAAVETVAFSTEAKFVVYILQKTSV